jgi:hypothetical protein
MVEKKKNENILDLTEEQAESLKELKGDTNNKIYQLGENAKRIGELEDQLEEFKKNKLVIKQDLKNLENNFQNALGKILKKAKLTNKVVTAVDPAKRKMYLQDYKG